MAYHQDLESMRETYIHDPDFGKVMEKIQQEESHSQYSLMAIFSRMTGFVLLRFYGKNLCLSLMLHPMRGIGVYFPLPKLLKGSSFGRK